MSDEHAHKEEHPKKHKKHQAHAAHEEHEEGVPEWVVSFADNVLLQMGFFVILLAMNLGQKGAAVTADPEGVEGEVSKVKDSMTLDFAIAVREAFHNPVDLGSTAPEDLPLIQRLKERMGTQALPQTGTKGKSEGAQAVRPSDFVNICAVVDFQERDSTLSPTASAELAEAIKELVGTRWIIEVRGHVSRLEAHRDVQGGRMLSYERAWNVAQSLVAAGLSWEQLRLVACGEADPAKPRARTAQDHGDNQRAEIVVLQETLPDDPYGVGR